MQGDVDVISTKLRRWERGGTVRYYHDWWIRYLKNEQIADYKARFGMSPNDFHAGIRVYFDGIGELHIDFCRDPELESFLERMMTRWYWYTYVDYIAECTKRIRIDDLVSPFMTDIKPGFRQIRYGGLVVNLDDARLSKVMKKGLVGYDARNKRYMIKSTQPRLDAILERITADHHEKILAWIHEDDKSLIGVKLVLRSQPDTRPHKQLRSVRWYGTS